jgi:tetratricopeptide (TPR) repeat protein
MSYTTREVEQLLGLKATRVRSFVRDGFLQPDRGPRGELRFSFQDLVLLRTARGLIDAAVPPAHVRRALTQLRSRLPEGTSLAGVHIRADGRRIVVREGEALWQLESGQAVFDFDVDELARGVASLDRQRGRTRAPDARDDADFDAERWYLRGYEIEEDDPDGAREAYQKALDLDPDHLEAHINLGRLLHDLGDLVGAERHYRAGLALDPDGVTAIFNLAVALEDLGRGAEAVTMYERALEADPGCADAHFNLARLLAELGQRPAALRHLQAYRKLTRD